MHAGGVIAYPTESCYGLGCDPRNNRAIRDLLGIKQRHWNKGLIIIAASVEQLDRYIDREQLNMNKVLQSWPGPTTWLLPASRDCPNWLSGEHDTLAVRVSAHPLVRRLCDILDGAIVSTSANTSGQRPARSVLDSARLVVM